MDVAGGRYRLVEVIGTGGMGRVWRGVDELLGRTVAVKEMAGTRLDSIREARAAARLDHPHVVTVYDVVWHPDRSWIVMEYVASRSLHEVVGEDGPLTHREAARIGLQVTSALRAAHAAGVLHRDVKPQNVLLAAADGRAVLGDFGLATIAGHLGGLDPMMGSPYYVAPERIEPGQAGEAGDLWSLGATLHTAVEGRPPFARDNVTASLLAVLHDEPDPPQHPGPLTGVIRDLLVKDPEQRLSLAEVESRLRRIAEPSRIQARVPVPGPRSPKRGRIVLAGAVVALLGTGGAALAFDGGHDAGTGQPAAVTSALPSSAPLPAALCGPDPQAVTKAATRIPSGLPAGWIWTRDPAGFALAVPQGWPRTQNGSDVCFRDPAGRRAFTVSTTALSTRRPLVYWQGREKAETIPGYARISMGVLLLRRGGADWEYTYRPDSDTTRHVRRVLLAVTGKTSYVLRFETADRDWTASLPQQRQFLTLFASAT